MGLSGELGGREREDDLLPGLRKLAASIRKELPRRGLLAFILGKPRKENPRFSVYVCARDSGFEGRLSEKRFSGMTVVVSAAPGEREICWVVPVSSPLKITVFARQNSDHGSHQAMDQLWMLGKSRPSGSALQVPCRHPKSCIN